MLSNELTENILKKCLDFFSTFLLRKNAWSGVPALKRGQVWRLLCGYEPSSLDRRRPALTRKRNEYKALIDRYFEPRNDPEHSHTERISKNVTLLFSFLTFHFIWVFSSLFFVRFTLTFHARTLASSYSNSVKFKKCWRGCCSFGPFVTQLVVTYKASTISRRPSW